MYCTASHGSVTLLVISHFEHIFLMLRRFVSKVTSCIITLYHIWPYEGKRVQEGQNTTKCLIEKLLVHCDACSEALRRENRSATIQCCVIPVESAKELLKQPEFKAF